MTDIDCPLCGAKLQKIWAKGRYFFGCSRYPDCSYTASEEQRTFNKEDYADGFNWDQPCPNCTKPMIVRFGRYGAFLGCSDYPKCKGIVNIPRKGEALQESMEGQERIPCPALGCPGHLMQRRSRFGKTFYSCSTYPECDVIANTPEQVAEKYVNYPRTAASKKPTRKKGATLKITSDMEAIVGKDVTSRPDITKKLWDYIKKQKLQDSNNRRLIVPDEALAKVFGSKEPLDMMKLAKVISANLL
jgi:DNA topoisomerase-1